MPKSPQLIHTDKVATLNSSISVEEIEIKTVVQRKLCKCQTTDNFNGEVYKIFSNTNVRLILSESRR